MKIAHQESSDAVKIYDIDNEMELVDTPGLFGFKAKEHDSGKIEHYKDITKKYISEALSFYTRSTRQTPSKTAIRTI